MKTLEDIISILGSNIKLTKNDNYIIEKLWNAEYEDLSNYDFSELLVFQNIDPDFDMILSDYEACLTNKP